MLGVKEMVSLGFIPFLVLASFAAAEESVQDLYERSYSDLPFDRRLQYLLETKSSINGIKNLIDELQNRLEIPWHFLNDLALNNEVTLRWVPGHEVIQRNEVVDSLAKKDPCLTLPDKPPCVLSKQKRTACALDGGLSASCNHKDAVEAGEHHRFLASSFAPGRRKRRSLNTLVRNFQIKN